MIKFKIIYLLIVLPIIFPSCSKVLEPVLFNETKGIDIENTQEEFDVNIHALTFSNALNANKDPYFRQLMYSGSGKGANVVDEAEFLISTIPDNLSKDNYKLGLGDKLSFSILNKYTNRTATWPQKVMIKDYQMGIGDEVTISIMSKNTLKVYEDGKLGLNSNNDKIYTSKAIIGSDGVVTLLGIGNFEAVNKTLSKFRTEVRNVMLRESNEPNFQIEISKYNSKKVFLTINGQANKIIPLTSTPTSLQQVVLTFGLTNSDDKTALITLARKNETFRLTNEQIFAATTPEILLLDNDKINISIISIISETQIPSIATVGLNGQILLPIVGNINVLNQTLNQVYDDIKNILVAKGLLPDFQLELIEFNSKKVYLLQKNVHNAVIPLTNTEISLKELILGHAVLQTEGDGLYVIELKRNKQIYRMPLDKILNSDIPEIWLRGDDQVEIKYLPYKPGQVFALSGNGNASIMNIDPSKRETLANVIFDEKGVLNNLNAKRSAIYLLRGKNPLRAYHLDVQNVSKILIAAKTELRPNDIIYAAERPIISFSRVLEEITPLRLLLRDLKNNDLP